MVIALWKLTTSNTLTVQKGGSWIDKQSLELKAFHNEEDGQAYSNLDSVVQNFFVTWNYIYTGTPIALKKKVNEQNFGSGLATRLTCIPLPSTNFEMMERERAIISESWPKSISMIRSAMCLPTVADSRRPSRPSTVCQRSSQLMTSCAVSDSKVNPLHVAVPVR